VGKFDSDTDWINLAKDVGTPGGYKFPIA